MLWVLLQRKMFFVRAWLFAAAVRGVLRNCPNRYHHIAASPAVPAIPLTMTAGVIFGVVPGTAVVSVAGTLACTISFLIARYVARDKVG